MCVTKNDHFLLGVSCDHPVQLWDRFDGSRLVFHGSMSVFIGFQGFRLVLHFSRSVFMAFQGSRLVLRGSRLVFHGSRLVFHGARMFFMVFKVPG